MEINEEGGDRHLEMALDEVITAIQTTKQAVWSASNAGVRDALSDLKIFLGEQAGALLETAADATDSLVSPTGRAPRNLRARAGHDQATFRALVLDELRAIAADVRAHAAAISDSRAEMLMQLADGMDARLDIIARAAGQ